MDVREKLVELFYDNNVRCDQKIEGLADDVMDIISHGVTVQEWISVNDRLPENNQWALCFMKDKSFGTFRVLQWNYIDWQWNDGNERWEEKDVTHWMPLPLPPKGE